MSRPDGDGAPGRDARNWAPDAGQARPVEPERDPLRRLVHLVLGLYLLPVLLLVLAVGGLLVAVEMVLRLVGRLYRLIGSIGRGGSGGGATIAPFRSVVLGLSGDRRARPFAPPEALPRRLGE